jgi:hypothetical protein
VSDHVLRPEYSSLQRCEGLVPVDSGKTLNVFTVAVTLHTALYDAVECENLTFIFNVSSLILRFSTHSLSVQIYFVK